MYTKSLCLYIDIPSQTNCKIPSTENLSLGQPHYKSSFFFKRTNACIGIKNLFSNLLKALTHSGEHFMRKTFFCISDCFDVKLCTFLYLRVTSSQWLQPMCLAKQMCRNSHQHCSGQTPRLKLNIFCSACNCCGFSRNVVNDCHMIGGNNNICEVDNVKPVLQQRWCMFLYLVVYP